jgi:hypothetical protein
MRRSLGRLCTNRVVQVEYYDIGRIVSTLGEPTLHLSDVRQGFDTEPLGMAVDEVLDPVLVVIDVQDS